MAYKQVLDRPTALVAGGAGFIGSHLIDELVKTRNVICVDNFVTGQEENIDLLIQSPNFKFIKHDLKEPLDLNKSPELDVFKVKFQGVQEIYNLACPTSPKEYNRLPVETLLANSHVTYNLLELAVQYKAKFLLASTSAVYGEPSDVNHPFSEDFWGFIDPVGPRSCYNEGKRFAESMTTSYGQHKGVNYRVARIFNTYGPRMKLHDGRMIPDMINHALTNRPLVIYGSPEASATFCYISDMIDGLVKLMEQETTGVFNLGNPKVHQVGQVAKLILQMTNSTSDVQVKASLPYLAQQGLPDITKIKESLGWFPLVPLEVGLQRTVDYFKGHENLLGFQSQPGA